MLGQGRPWGWLWPVCCGNKRLRTPEQQKGSVLVEGERRGDGRRVCPGFAAEPCPGQGAYRDPWSGGQGGPGGLRGREYAGDPGSIPGLGTGPGEGYGSPLQCSHLRNPKHSGTWWATVHGAAKSPSRLSDWMTAKKGCGRPGLSPWASRRASPHLLRAGSFPGANQDWLERNKPWSNFSNSRAKVKWAFVFRKQVYLLPIPMFSTTPWLPHSVILESPLSTHPHPRCLSS